MKKPLFIVLVGMLSFQQFSFAEDNTDEFVAAVNEAWCSFNYPALEEIISARLVEYPDDLLALGLCFAYHDSVIVDFHKARNAANAYITAVSNRMPSEVTNRRIPLNLALHLLEMPIPSVFPTNQLKTPAQMSAMHKEFPDEFPFLFLYRAVPERIQRLEASEITDHDLLWLKESVFLGNEIPNNED